MTHYQSLAVFRLACCLGSWFFAGKPADASGCQCIDSFTGREFHDWAGLSRPGLAGAPRCRIWPQGPDLPAVGNNRPRAIATPVNLEWLTLSSLFIQGVVLARAILPILPSFMSYSLFFQGLVLALAVLASVW